MEYNYSYQLFSFFSLIYHYFRFINEDDLYGLLYEVLELSKEGLIKRGFGEEQFLNSLYERVEKHTNPARRMLTLLEDGCNIETIIKEYGEL